MTQFRAYHRADATQAGRLIRDTYSHYNLAFLPREQQADFLGPFQYADSPDPAHQEAIHQVIQSEIIILAEDQGQIVGLLRGRLDRLGSLFVRGDYHHQGIGSSLVRLFEQQIQEKGGKLIRVASTVYAVPFYERMHYKKSTGLRKGSSFQGRGLPIQPMKKILVLGG